MPELRWTLLIVGIVFIVALALWERRRPHQAARDSGESRSSGTEPTWTSDGDLPSTRVIREPTMSLPEIRAREPVSRELPVVEIPDDDSLIGLRIDGERVEEQEDIVPTEPEEEAPEEELEKEPEAEYEPPLAPMTTEQPIVEWPADDVRKLVAIRLVSGHSERLAGRSIRQALAAEGFVLGKFDIFHKPDRDNRAVLSAASLTKPGTFDLETMDTQRFGGLNLFAVLPGPKPPQKAFEELLVTARALNERLQGALQDERGGPLTPTRIAALREGLEAEAGS
jgi:cell division protein ZipA